MITVFGIGSAKGSYLQDISDCPRNEDGLRDEDKKPPVSASSICCPEYRMDRPRMPGGSAASFFPG